MRRSWITFLCLSLLSLFSFGADIHKGNFGAAQGETAKKVPAPTKRTTYPFSGELDSHDAKSITLKGKRKSRIVLLTAETRILRNGSPAKAKDMVLGERVSGSTYKNAAGLEEALTVNLKGIQQPAPK